MLSRHAHAAGWIEASLRVPADCADRVGTWLVEAGSQGVVTGVRELGRRSRTYETVRAFFPSSEPVRARLAVHAALRRAADAGVTRARVAWRDLDSRLWEIDWREHFQPVLAGSSLVVVPPWNRRRHAGRRRIVIHPGMAFGTGQHATTLACLEAIERLAAPPPARALDVGTGTGILAIALAKLGVRRVWAIDIDPAALAAARDNLRRNGVARRVRLLSTPRVPAAPLVVANLYIDELVRLEPTLRARVTPGGRLVASGMLRTQQRRLRTAFAPTRWRVCETIRRGPWLTTILERRSPVAGAARQVRAASRRPLERPRGHAR